MAEEGESPAASLAEVTGRALGALLPLARLLGSSGAGRKVMEGALNRGRPQEDGWPPGALC